MCVCVRVCVSVCMPCMWVHAGLHVCLCEGMCACLVVCCSARSCVHVGAAGLSWIAGVMYFDTSDRVFRSLLIKL